MSIEKTKFSIIIPVYNASDIIRNTLDSIRSQSYNNYEVLITNDGSTDDTEKTLEKYKKEYSQFPLHYVTQKNAGVSSARNNSISRATGDYVAFLDQDDLWFPGKLNEVYKAINENSGANVFYHESIAVGLKRKVNFIKYGALKEPYHLDLLFNFNRIGISTAVAEINILKAVGGFDENYRYSEDYDLWLKLARRGVIFHHIPFFLSKYIWSPESMSNQVDNMTAEKIKIFEENCSYLFKENKYDRQFLNSKYKRAKSRTFFGSSRRLYFLGDYIKAKDYCFLAIKTDKKFWKPYVGLILLYLKPKISFFHRTGKKLKGFVGN
jgi:glycosyltransferase involved in cell wall biosynthesis